MRIEEASSGEFASSLAGVPFRTDFRTDLPSTWISNAVTLPVRVATKPLMFLTALKALSYYVV